MNSTLPPADLDVLDAHSVTSMDHGMPSEEYKGDHDSAAIAPEGGYPYAYAYTIDAAEEDPITVEAAGAMTGRYRGSSQPAVGSGGGLPKRYSGAGAAAWHGTTTLNYHTVVRKHGPVNYFFDALRARFAHPARRQRRRRTGAGRERRRRRILQGVYVDLRTERPDGIEATCSPRKILILRFAGTIRAAF
jgi:hypothetical protein